jgi:hypothetical protein
MYVRKTAFAISGCFCKIVYLYIFIKIALADFCHTWKIGGLAMSGRVTEKKWQKNGLAIRKIEGN